MSTPIETNTEQLQEVLQQVYNLPNRSGGSNSYDLIINMSGEYWTAGADYDPYTNLTIAYDEEALQTTAAKIQSGEKASVIIRFNLVMDSGSPYDGVMYPVMVTGYSSAEFYSISVVLQIFNPSNYNRGKLLMRIGSGGWQVLAYFDE